MKSDLEKRNPGLSLDKLEMCSKRTCESSFRVIPDDIVSVQLLKSMYSIPAIGGNKRFSG